MQYVVHYGFVSDNVELLSKFRSAHKAHVDEWEDRLHLAYLHADDDGANFQASIFVLALNERADAERFSNSDPYFVNGVFGERTIARFIKRRGWN